MRWLAAAIVLLNPDLTLAQARPAIADAYVRQSWDTGDGLPQNSVTAILQTRDGYLWVGTFGGLARFDGNAFTVFTPSDTPGLADARIVGLYEDRQGVLWIATQRGLVRHEGGRFSTYSVRDGLTQDALAAFASDRRGRFWLASRAPFMHLAGDAIGGLSPVPETPSAFAEMPDGSVWVGSANAIERFANGDMSAPAERFAGTGASDLLVDTRGRLWAASGGLRRWNGSSFIDVALGVDPSVYGRIVAMAEDHEGAFWLATTRSGVLRWRDDVSEPYGPAEVTNGTIRSLHVDRDGNIWIGTNLGGLIRLKARRIRSYQRPGSSSQSIGPIISDGASGLWIGATCGGLLHFRAGTLRVHEISERLHPCIWALHRDPDGTLWAGSSVGTVDRVQNGEVTRFKAADGLPGGFVSSIARDGDGVLWVGTNRGLARMDAGAGRFSLERIGAFPDDTPVTRVVTARDGALWIGHAAGLTRLRRGESQSWSQADGLSHHHVRDIYEDDDGVVWIATYAGGLNRFENGRFTVYQTKDGLFDNAVSRIIDDGRNFWMSGNNGIFRVARSQLNDFAAGRLGHLTGVLYGTADGMVTNETNGGGPAGWRTGDGRLWFPTIRGLVGIDPGATPLNPPPVFVERAIVQGQTVEPGAMTTLGPGDVDAEFHYTAVDLSAAEKTRFRYRLDGYDKDWIDAGARRVAYYTKVPPGRYVFIVGATDGDGAWTATPRHVPLTIRPFWWQRTEVRAAAVFALMALTALAARSVALRRSRARVAALERAQALDRERSRIARDLHDDLGTRLSHIAILAGAGDPDRRVALEAVAAVRTMDELVWSVNARNDTVESLAYYLAQFAEEHIPAAGLRCRLDLPPDLPATPLASDARRHLFLAVKEAVTNAVKHAQASEISVAMRIDPQGLAIVVADDGVGLPPEVDPTGNGLRNFEERMRLAGGTLSVETAPGRGTRLTFAVPLTAGAHAHAPDAGTAFGTE